MSLLNSLTNEGNGLLATSEYLINLNLFSFCSCLYLVSEPLILSMAALEITYSPSVNKAGTSSLVPEPPVTRPPWLYLLIIPPSYLPFEPKNAAMTLPIVL